MADEILQSLGFDASDALDALAKMDSALGGFEARLGSVGDAMATWNAKAAETVQILKDIASNANLAAEAMAKLHGAFGAQQAAAPGKAPSQPAEPVTPTEVPKVTPQIDKTPIEDADKAAGKFIVSWQTLSRVVMTQAIVRAQRHARRDARGVRLQSAIYDPHRGDSIGCAGGGQQSGFTGAECRQLVPRVQHSAGASGRGSVSGDLESVRQHRAAVRLIDGRVQAFQGGRHGRRRRR